MIRSILLAVLLLATLPGSVAAERDPLAPLPDLPQSPVISVPAGLFEPEQIQALAGIVGEARDFGVPLAVRVISLPAIPTTLPGALPTQLAAPSSQAIVQRMADDWLAGESLETSPVAADGILLFVIVPKNDHTRSMAAFATGKNALPLNGLTRQSLAEVLETEIHPAFGHNSIAGGIYSGVARLSYDNLFARPARLARSHQQETLYTVTNTVLSGLTVAASLALIGLAWWIRRRRPVTPGAAIESPFEAGALLRGRVDDAVVAGALLHLVGIGALVPDGNRLRLAADIPVDDPFTRDIVDTLARESGHDGTLSPAALHRIQDLLLPARSRLEDRLASRGLLNPAARVESAWLILASALVAVIAAMAVVPSIVSMSRIGIAGILIAVLTITGILIWTARRSWVTPAGRDALRAWLDRPHRDDDFYIADAIVHQNALLESPGGPGVPPITHLTRQLRALGAG